jgi:hypothetical protein
MRKASRHIEWLSLIEVSGPFIAVSMLEKTLPQGLEAVETPRRQRLREAYEEWRDAVDEDDPQLIELHREWIRLVIMELLEYDREVLHSHNGSDGTCTYRSPDHPVTFSPAYVVRSAGDEKPRLLISIQPPGTDLETARLGDGWPSTLVERMVLLCRSAGVQLGLLTDGERWMLVNAPIGAPSSHASWYARLWFQEPVTLKAFQSLLGVRRCFGPAEEALDALLEESLKHHEEVTDTLGEQVRRAVEVLVQCLDKADQDRNRELLRDVSPAELYEAGLTVMMRLVFVLCAEERDLLLLGDPVYDQCYAISTMRGQLAEEGDHHGPEVLDRRHDAWARLLAVFRAVYAGIEHESLRIPALGGSLFDPDRFPFLEGRLKGTHWRDTAALPLPIDNRTVLLLLSSLQVLEQPGGALLLSYRALDVEQVGHVYEGLLEHTVARVTSVTLGLLGSGKAKNPNLPLPELESASMDGEGTLLTLLLETTKRSESAILNALARPVEDAVFGRLLSVCGGDTDLAERIRPYANLIRTDAWDEPIVYRGNAFMVTLGADRRETGTHYTPKSLTESIVETTLEPVAYVGPAEGKPREGWRLRSPAELLDLKICDPAMGSGAFLVQACRWLAERLVEAWAGEETAGKFVTADGDVRENVGEADPMPTALDERLLLARRLIAERCLYGADINPLAVELAKMSIWLVNLAKGRPFGFLDHNLRQGDSLLGIHRLDQLTKLKMNPDDGSCQKRIFGKDIADKVDEVIEIRKRLRAIPIRDIRDIEIMVRLDREAREKLKAVELLADAMISEALRSNGNILALDLALDSLAVLAGDFLNGNAEIGETIIKANQKGLSVDLLEGKPPRKLFHWPLEFPEVFIRENSGFDAIIGNPPFLGGRRITGILGDAYREYLVQWIADGNRGSSVDLVAYFFLRVYEVLRSNGNFGLLAVNTISEGDTRQIGLERMVRKGAFIYAAYPNEPWPGKAAVVTSRVHVRKGIWSGTCMLFSKPVAFISAFLSDQEEWSPKHLKSNDKKVFQGSIVLGMGFVLSEAEADAMIKTDPKNAEVMFPYLNGEDLNTDFMQRASRWVINFWDWPEEKAKEYELPFQLILERVKPERQRKDKNGKFILRNPLPERWWHFADKRPALYHTIGRGHAFQRHPKGWQQDAPRYEHVLVRAQVSKTHAPVFVPTDQVLSMMCVVFATESHAFFALIQSKLHEVWVAKFSSSLKTDQRYTPTDCFETFPFPPALTTELEMLGKSYHSHRGDILKALKIGLTDCYRRFNNPENTDNFFEELREKHRQIDEAVTIAYGWRDLDLGHGFHEVPYLPENDRVRFTISEGARLEVLRRLAILNRDYYEEEARLGLHSKNSFKSSIVGRRQAAGRVISRRNIE